MASAVFVWETKEEKEEEEVEKKQYHLFIIDNNCDGCVTEVLHICFRYTSLCESMSLLNWWCMKRVRGLQSFFFFYFLFVLFLKMISLRFFFSLLLSVMCCTLYSTTGRECNNEKQWKAIDQYYVKRLLTWSFHSCKSEWKIDIKGK